MSLWVRQFVLIFGLIFTLFACEDSGRIGLDLDPESGTFTAKYVEIPMRTSVLLLDSVYTRGHSRLLVSHFRDPEFGVVDTRGYARLFLGLSPFEPDDNAVFDSLIFKFGLTYQYGPKDYLPQGLNVHELLDTIGNELKFSWDSTAYMQEPIGQGNFNLIRLDTIWLDTVLSIRLADTLGLRFLQGAKDNPETFANHSKFTKFFNGIALTPPATNTKALAVNLLSGDSKVTLYYHVPPDTVLKSYAFNFFSTDGYNSSSAFYHSIKPDFSGTALEGLKETNVEFDPGDGLTYTQAGTGVVTRLSLSPLYKFLDTISNVVVNRAELTFQTETFVDYLSPPGPMQIYVINTDNQFVFVNGQPKKLRNEEDPSKELFLTYHEDEVTGIRTYQGVVSIFTQELISGNSEDSLLVIRPFNSGSTVNRFVSDNTTVMLKLYYSLLE